MSEPIAEQVALYGAGGHCASLMGVLEDIGTRVVRILDDDASKAGQRIGGVRIEEGNLNSASVDFGGLPVIVAIARNEVRRTVVERLELLKVRVRGVRHPSAVLSSRAQVHPSVHVMPGVIVNAGAVIHPHVVLNTGSIVEHDTVVEGFCHIGPGAVLAGAVAVGEGSFVATGARVCPFVRIGAGSILGAAALALRDIPAGCVAVGVPARILQKAGER